MSPNAKSIAAAAARAPGRLRDPVVQAGLLLVLKAPGAAVVAWLLAVQVLDLSQPFLAPWSALLTVHATVYRSVSRGAQQVGSTVLGVLLAFVLEWRRSGVAALGWGIIGLVLTFVAAGVQQAALGVHPRYFDHNALYHLIQGLALWAAVLIVVVSTLADVVLVLLDPRVRASGHKAR